MSRTTTRTKETTSLSTAPVMDLSPIDFWEAAAQEALRHGAVLHFAMADLEHEFIKNQHWIPAFPTGGKPKATWVKSWADVAHTTAAILNAGGRRKTALIEKAIDALKSVCHPEIGKGGALDQAIAYTDRVLNESDVVRANISATAFALCSQR
jgi:hypothetical protein